MTVTYQRVLDLAASRIGDRFVLGVDVPLDDADYRGPWDCAEFVSWVAKQATGQVLGASPGSNPDPFTGHWYDQINRAQAVSGSETTIAAAPTLRRVSVTDAMRIPGSVLVRRPQPGAFGHIVIVGVNGTSVEAYSSEPPPQGGVRTLNVTGRRWDLGGLLPEVDYVRFPPLKSTPTRVLRRGSTGSEVRRLQALLKVDVDGVFGRETLAAVVAFQRQNGLVPDGEVGPLTWAKLEGRG